MFTGNEQHRIPLDEAADLTARYRASHTTDNIIGLYYSKTFLTSVLGQENCVGIRAYFGESTDEKPQLILVGVDADGDDLTDGVFGEYGKPCPPYCNESNPLNSDE